DLVSGFGVVRAEQVGEIEVAEGTQSMIDGDMNDVAFANKVASVGYQSHAATEGEAAAVQPHHHRTCTVVECGCRHLECETVLRNISRRDLLITFLAQSDRHQIPRCGSIAHLRAHRCILERVEHAAPRRHRPRRTEAALAACVRTVRYAAKLEHLVT